MGFSSDKVWSNDYNLPMQPQVIIKDPMNIETLYSFNPFNNDDQNPFKLKAVSFGDGNSQTGDVRIEIDDSIDRVIDRNILDNGCIFVLQDGRKENELLNRCTGYINSITTRIGEGGLRDYILEGQGLGKILTFRHVNLIKQVASTNPSNPKPVFDPQFRIFEIFKSVLTDTSVLPFGTPSLISHGHFTMEKISSLVKEFIPTLNYPMVTAAFLFNSLADIVGASWGVDENNSIYLNYPGGTDSHTGVILKNKDNEEETDLAQFTAYNLGRSFVFRDSIRPEDGFCQVIMAFTKSENLTGQFNSNSYSSLYRHNRGQQIIADSTKFQNISLVLSRVGGGTTQPNPETAVIYGLIMPDGSDMPITPVIAHFTIPVKDIPETPTLINKIKIVFTKGNDEIEPNRKYWIILARSGDSEENTIRWWHTNVVTSGLKSGSRFVGASDTESIDGNTIISGWLTSDAVNFTYAVSSTEQYLVSSADPLSILRWSPSGPVEAFVNSNFTNDPYTLQRFLDSILFFSAKAQRIYEPVTISIPYNRIKSGRFISVRDSELALGLPHEDTEWEVLAEIQESSINYLASHDATGTDRMTIKCKGYVSPTAYSLRNRLTGEEETPVEYENTCYTYV